MANKRSSSVMGAGGRESSSGGRDSSSGGYSGNSESHNNKILAALPCAAPPHSSLAHQSQMRVDSSVFNSIPPPSSRSFPSQCQGAELSSDPVQLNIKNNEERKQGLNVLLAVIIFISTANNHLVLGTSSSNYLRPSPFPSPPLTTTEKQNVLQLHLFLSWP
jgi:hypothetical protein